METVHWYVFVLQPRNTSSNIAHILWQAVLFTKTTECVIEILHQNVSKIPLWHIPPNHMDIYEDFDARSRYLRQGWLIAAHSVLWDAIAHLCMKYLLLSLKSSHTSFEISYILLWIWLQIFADFNKTINWGYLGTNLAHSPIVRLVALFPCLVPIQASSKTKI